MLLATLFAAPGLAAYFFYQHPSWLGSAKVNKGTLLSPPLDLKALHDQSKWRMVLWYPGVCESSCFAYLDKLARIRLALGRKLYAVDQVLILGSELPIISEALQTVLKQKDFHLLSLPEKEKKQLVAIASDAKIFLANPAGYFILSYELQAKSEDIYKDLDRLLHAGERGGV